MRQLKIILFCTVVCILVGLFIRIQDERIAFRKIQIYSGLGKLSTVLDLASQHSSGITTIDSVDAQFIKADIFVTKIIKDSQIIYFWINESMTDVESYFWVVIPIDSESGALVLKASVIVGCIAEQGKCVILKPTLHPDTGEYLTFAYHKELEFSIEPLQKFNKPIEPYAVFEQYKKIIKEAHNEVK